MKQEDLAAIQDGARLAGVLPYLQAEAATIKKGIENQVYAALREGTLTPDKAMFFWMQHLAARETVQKFEQKVRIGQTIGEVNKDLLER